MSAGIPFWLTGKSTYIFDAPFLIFSEGFAMRVFEHGTDSWFIEVSYGCTFDSSLLVCEPVGSLSYFSSFLDSIAVKNWLRFVCWDPIEDPFVKLSLLFDWMLTEFLCDYRTIFFLNSFSAVSDGGNWYSRESLC